MRVNTAIYSDYLSVSKILKHTQSISVLVSDPLVILIIMIRTKIVNN